MTPFDPEDRIDPDTLDGTPEAGDLIVYRDGTFHLVVGYAEDGMLRVGSEALGHDEVRRLEDVAATHHPSLFRRRGSL